MKDDKNHVPQARLAQMLKPLQRMCVDVIREVYTVIYTPFVWND